MASITTSSLPARQSAELRARLGSNVGAVLRQCWLPSAVDVLVTGSEVQRWASAWCRRSTRPPCISSPDGSTRSSTSILLALTVGIGGAMATARLQDQPELRRLGSVPGWWHHLLLSHTSGTHIQRKPPFGAASFFVNRAHETRCRHPGESRGQAQRRAGCLTIRLRRNEVPVWRGLGYDGGSTVQNGGGNGVRAKRGLTAGSCFA